MNQFTKTALFSFMFATALVAEEADAPCMPTPDIQTMKKQVTEQLFEQLSQQKKSNPNDFEFIVKELTDRRLICIDHKTEFAIVCVEENILAAMVQARLDYLKEQKLEDSAEKTA